MFVENLWYSMQFYHFYKNTYLRSEHNFGYNCLKSLKKCRKIVSKMFYISTNNVQREQLKSKTEYKFKFPKTHLCN